MKKLILLTAICLIVTSCSTSYISKDAKTIPINKQLIILLTDKDLKNIPFCCLNEIDGEKVNPLLTKREWHIKPGLHTYKIKCYGSKITTSEKWVNIGDKVGHNRVVTKSGYLKQQKVVTLQYEGDLELAAGKYTTEDIYKRLIKIPDALVPN